MAFEPTQVSDCMSIAKKFNRGASFATTDESVFAMMTPMLNIMRTQSSSLVTQIETQETISSPLTTEDKILQNQGVAPTASTPNTTNLENIDKSDDQDQGIAQRIAGNFFPGGEGQVPGTGNLVDAEIFGNVFNSKCIPCGPRLNMLGELDFKSGITEYLQYWKQWLLGHYTNLLSMLNIFNGADQLIDLCALIEFLKNFVCVPDLARILSALMAMMLQLSFDFGGIFDLILQLVAPLLQPFLSNFVNMLQQYILLIIRPLECIIDSLQNIIARLDYNVLFQNINSLDKNISIGRRQ